MNQTQAKPQTQNQVATVEKTLSEKVQNRVNQLTSEGKLNLPSNYSVGNAINSAWLKILQTKDRNGKPAMEVCTKESIANALLDMAILGLNPAKQQGYFIVYGTTLTWFTSYFGNCAAVQRLSGCESEPIATLIYEGDELELTHTEYGEELVIKHNTSWTNKIKNVIVGAYATVKFNGKIRSAVMTIEEIKESWSKSISDKEHKMFTGEFAKRTVLNRLTKMILKTSNDDDLLAETMIDNENKHYDYEESIEVTEEKAKIEVTSNANTGEVVDVKGEETPVVEPEIVETSKPKQPEQPKVSNRGF